jgi:hypothetical protein
MSLPSITISVDNLSQSHNHSTLNNSHRDMPPTEPTGANPSLLSPEPSPSIMQRQQETTQEIARFLQYHQMILHDKVSAQTITSAMMNFVTEATEGKRRFRTECLSRGLNILNSIKTDDNLKLQSKQYPGKLNHATIVAYAVGIH